MYIDNFFNFSISDIIVGYEEWKISDKIRWFIFIFVRFLFNRIEYIRID